MTRYSFVLLISRVIGILSLIAILKVLQNLSLLQATTKYFQSSKQPAQLMLPTVAIVVGFAILISGCITGLAALRLAKFADMDAETSDKLLPLGFASIVFWVLVEEKCFRLIGLGFLSWAARDQINDSKFFAMIAQRMGVQLEPVADKLWVTAAVFGGFAGLVAYALWRRTEEMPS